MLGLEEHVRKSVLGPLYQLVETLQISIYKIKISRTNFYSCSLQTDPGSPSEDFCQPHVPIVLKRTNKWHA